MWRELDEIVLDLQSDQPEVIIAAILEVYERPWFEEVPIQRLDLQKIIPAIQPQWTYGVVSSLFSIIVRYEWIVPPMSMEERVDALVEIMMLSRGDMTCSALNLFAKGQPDQLPTVIEAVHAQLDKEGARDTIGFLFSYLLNAEPGFRAQVVAALRGPEWHEVRDFVRLELEPEELASLEG